MLGYFEVYQSLFAENIRPLLQDIRLMRAQFYFSKGLLLCPFKLHLVISLIGINQIFISAALQMDITLVNWAVVNDLNTPTVTTALNYVHHTS